MSNSSKTVFCYDSENGAKAYDVVAIVKSERHMSMMPNFYTFCLSFFSIVSIG